MVKDYKDGIKKYMETGYKNMILDGLEMEIKHGAPSKLVINGLLMADYLFNLEDPEEDGDERVLENIEIAKMEIELLRAYGLNWEADEEQRNLDDFISRWQ